MTNCPHCQKPGVYAWRARWSDPACPATCTLCAGLSHVPAGEASAVVTILLVFASVMAGALTGSLLLGIGGSLLALGYSVWCWQRLALLPLPADRARTAGRVGLGVAVLSVLMSIWR